ncbi:MAG: hypothetical protein JW787_10310 [Sedimentisphaerales bacterium]|nr:hypothetical protein [Sedimentisphaerales bacterium]
MELLVVIAIIAVLLAVLIMKDCNFEIRGF